MLKCLLIKSALLQSILTAGTVVLLPTTISVLLGLINSSEEVMNTAPSDNLLGLGPTLGGAMAAVAILLVLVVVILAAFLLFCRRKSKTTVSNGIPNIHREESK